MKFKYHTVEQINKAIDKLEGSYTQYYGYLALDQKCPYCGKWLECDIDVVWCETKGCVGFSEFLNEEKIQ